MKFDDTDIKTYLRLSGYVIGVAQLNNVGYCGYILTSTKSGSYSKVLTIGLQGLWPEMLGQEDLREKSLVISILPAAFRNG